MTKKEKMMRKRQQRARMRMGTALLLMLLVLLWPAAGIVDEATEEGSAQQQIFAPDGSLASSAAAPTPTIAPTATPEPTQTPEPTATPIPEPVTITLTFGGDCTLGGDVNKNNTRFQSYVDENGYAYFFENLKEVFENDDLTIINLEGPLTEAKEKRANRQFNFRCDPANVQILVEGDVEVAHLANNHAKDFLTAGYEDTVKYVAEAGIAGYGYKQTQIIEVKGVKVGFIGLTEWDYDVSEVKEMISELRAECDILVASFHWGEEKRYTSTTEQRRYAKAAVEAGADVVVGHHSHVVSGVTEYEDVPVVFSVGNLCFGGNSSPYDMDAMLFQPTFTVDHTGTIIDTDFEVIPVRISGDKSMNGYQPHVAEGKDAERILDKISEYSTVNVF